MIKRATPKRPRPDLKELQDMTEPELSKHFSNLMQLVDERQPDDVIGTMIITFQKNGISQYVSTVDPVTVPAALRELATRLQRRESVTRP